METEAVVGLGTVIPKAAPKVMSPAIAMPTEPSDLNCQSAESSLAGETVGAPPPPPPPGASAPSPPQPALTTRAATRTKDR